MRSVQAGECGVNVVIAVVGSRWKPTILWRLSQGDHRFAQLRRGVGDITEKVLTDQLRELERDGLVRRTDHEVFPRRVDYALTELGAELDELLTPLSDWGDRHASQLLGSRSA